jgi:branched-chain amino acid transport system permease protein
VRALARLGRFVETPVILVLLVVAALAAASLADILENRVVNMLIMLILVVGLYVFAGNSGVFSFGQIGFMAIGAYTTAIVRIPPDTKAALFPHLPDIQLSPVLATLLGGGVAALAAFLVSIPLMRLSGLAASLGTFAFLNIVYVVASNWTTISGGSTGLANVPQTTTRYNGLAWLAGIILLAWGFQRTRHCLRLRTSREDEVAAAAVGVGIYPERIVGFVLSGFISGIGGALFAQYYGTFNPDAFFVTITFLTVAMLVIGGRLSLSGAVVGTIFVTAATEFLRRVEGGMDLGLFSIPARPGLQDVGVALTMLIVLLLRPAGLTGGEELTLGRRLHRRLRGRTPSRPQTPQDEVA